MRETNVASAGIFTVVPEDEAVVGGVSFIAGDEVKFEPFGWGASQGFDPVAWLGFPDGAIAINVFNLTVADQEALMSNWGTP
jgi:hypothetical protein